MGDLGYVHADTYGMPFLIVQDSFGSKFNMLAERGDHRGILRTITGAAKLVDYDPGKYNADRCDGRGAEVLGAIGWFKSLFSLVPIPHDVKYLWALGEQSVQERQVHAPLNKDIFFRMVSMTISTLITCGSSLSMSLTKTRKKAVDLLTQLLYLRRPA